jgi:hypothetical protein
MFFAVPIPALPGSGSGVSSEFYENRRIPLPASSGIGMTQVEKEILWTSK